MPAFNSKEYIAESIESVIFQTYPYWELIIIDDGSNDSTKEIVENYAINDNRIKYYYQDNQRQGKARNNGISKSNGELIAFIDHDDLWIPEKLEIQLKFFNENKVDLLFSDGYLFSNDINNPFDSFKISTGLFQGEESLKLFLISNRIPMLSVLSRKKAIEECGGFEVHKSIQNADDYLLWLKMLIKGFSFYGMPDKLVYHRIHKKQASNDDPLSYEKVLYIFNDFLNVPPQLLGSLRKAKLIWIKNWYNDKAKNKEIAFEILNKMYYLNNIKLIATIMKLVLFVFSVDSSKKFMQKLIAIKLRLA